MAYIDVNKPIPGGLATIDQLIGSYASPEAAVQDFDRAPRGRDYLVEQYQHLTGDAFADPFEDAQKSRGNIIMAHALGGGSIATGDRATGPRILSPAFATSAPVASQGRRRGIAPLQLPGGVTPDVTDAITSAIQQVTAPAGTSVPRQSGPFMSRAAVEQAAEQPVRPNIFDTERYALDRRTNFPEPSLALPAPGSFLPTTSATQGIASTVSSAVNATRSNLAESEDYNRAVADRMGLINSPYTKKIMQDLGGNLQPIAGLADQSMMTDAAGKPVPMEAPAVDLFDSPNFQYLANSNDPVKRKLANDIFYARTGRDFETIRKSHLAQEQAVKKNREQLIEDLRGYTVDEYSGEEYLARSAKDEFGQTITRRDPLDARHRAIFEQEPDIMRRLYGVDIKRGGLQPASPLSASEMQKWPEYVAKARAQLKTQGITETPDLVRSQAEKLGLADQETAKRSSRGIVAGAVSDTTKFLSNEPDIFDYAAQGSGREVVHDLAALYSILPNVGISLGKNLPRRIANAGLAIGGSSHRIPLASHLATVPTPPVSLEEIERRYQGAARNRELWNRATSGFTY